MTDIIIAIISTIGACVILVASIGIWRMPDFYLRLSVTVKAATLGSGLLLLSAAIYFPQTSVTTKAIATIFFLILTAPVSGHMIGRAAYFIGTPLWKGTIRDDLKGMYDYENHRLRSRNEREKEENEVKVNQSKEGNSSSEPPPSTI
jgi:multicomponent Na+:H+ antiporter subunit G